MYMNELMVQVNEWIKEILKDNYVGVYFHGSLRLGSFNPNKSDLDFIIVVKHKLSPEIKEQLWDKMLENENNNAKLTGLDLNIDAINKLKKYNEKWKLYYMDFMDLNNVKFDTIILSSILHEILSYNSDLSKRFTGQLILEAFRKCNDLLEDNGTIILRDGLLSPINGRNNMLILSFTNINDGIWLYKF